MVIDYSYSLYCGLCPGNGVYFATPVKSASLLTIVNLTGQADTHGRTLTGFGQPAAEERLNRTRFDADEHGYSNKLVS